MAELTAILEHHGVWLLPAVGFLEYAGAPIASVPILIVAGALAAMGGVPLPAIVGGAATGALAADAVWYGVARWRGERMVGAVCGLSSNPRACVIGVERRVRAVRPAFLIPAKFLPGTGNLVAAAAGYAGMRFRTFLLVDALGAVLWAGAYSGLGWLLAPQIERVLDAVKTFGWWWAAAVALGLVAVGAVRRWRKVRRHRALHGAPAAEAQIALVPAE